MPAATAAAALLTRPPVQAPASSSPDPRLLSHAPPPTSPHGGERRMKNANARLSLRHHLRPPSTACTGAGGGREKLRGADLSGGAAERDMPGSMRSRSVSLLSSRLDQERLPPLRPPQAGPARLNLERCREVAARRGEEGLPAAVARLAASAASCSWWIEHVATGSGTPLGCSAPPGR